MPRWRTLSRSVEITFTFANTIVFALCDLKSNLSFTFFNDPEPLCLSSVISDTLLYITSCELNISLSSVTLNTLLYLASSSSWAPGSQWWSPLWMELAPLFWWVEHIVVVGDHGGNEYQDDNADADLKAHLARIDPAKIAGPLETAFQDVVTTDFRSIWFKNKQKTWC